MNLWRSLRFRVLLATTLTLLSALVLVLLLIAQNVEASLEEYFDQSLKGYLNQVAAVVSDENAGQRLDRQLGIGDFGRPYSGLYWQIQDEAGEVRRSRSLWDAAIALPTDTVAFDAIHIHQTTGPDGKTVRVLERRVIAADGTEWSIAVAGNRDNLDQEIRAFRERLLEFAGLLLGLTFLAGLVQYFVVQRPVTALGRSISSLNAGEQTRLVGKFPSELDGLIENLNKLIENNEHVAANARMQATSLAHTIKTPVAILKNELSALEGKRENDVDWPSIQSSLTKIERMSRFYLMRAKTTHRPSGAAKRIQVRPKLFDIVQTIRRLYQGCKLTITYECADQAVFSGDATDLEELLGNLIDNAAKWANSIVEIRCWSDATDFHLVIEDDGPGIPKASRLEILEPGIRLDSVVPGTGFGLAIVAELIAGYQGSVTLTDAQSGGLRVVVRVPHHQDEVSAPSEEEMS